MVKIAHDETLRKPEFCKVTHDLFRTERELDRAELVQNAMRNLCVWKTSLNCGCDE